MSRTPPPCIFYLYSCTLGNIWSEEDWQTMAWTYSFKENCGADEPAHMSRHVINLILNLNLHNLTHGAANPSHQIKAVLRVRLKHDDNVLVTSSRRDSLWYSINQTFGWSVTTILTLITDGFYIFISILLLFISLRWESWVLLKVSSS